MIFLNFNLQFSVKPLPVEMEIEEATTSKKSIQSMFAVTKSEVKQEETPSEEKEKPVKKEVSQ